MKLVGKIRGKRSTHLADMSNPVVMSLRITVNVYPQVSLRIVWQQVLCVPKIFLDLSVKSTIISERMA